AILLVTCDIPSACRTCEVISHSSTCACNKCNQQFPRLSDSNDVNYSGFVFSEWVSCTDAKNRRDAKLSRIVSSNAQRKRLERENGN
ncbi:hypothetical protein PHYBLDRAFT_104459, partial [Phycomyces blakesleeanus NRRL 1555(-)]